MLKEEPLYIKNVIFVHMKTLFDKNHANVALEYLLYQGSANIENCPLLKSRDFKTAKIWQQNQGIGPCSKITLILLETKIEPGQPAHICHLTSLYTKLLADQTSRSHHDMPKNVVQSQKWKVDYSIKGIQQVNVKRGKMTKTVESK